MLNKVDSQINFMKNFSDRNVDLLLTFDSVQWFSATETTRGHNWTQLQTLTLLKLQNKHEFATLFEKNFSRNAIKQFNEKNLTFQVV